MGEENKLLVLPTRAGVPRKFRMWMKGVRLGNRYFSELLGGHESHRRSKSWWNLPPNGYGFGEEARSLENMVVSLQAVTRLLPACSCCGIWSDESLFACFPASTITPHPCVVSLIVITTFWILITTLLYYWCLLLHSGRHPSSSLLGRFVKNTCNTLFFFSQISFCFPK